MTEPVLLYGIGATKAGTTWLYRALADRDDCALGAVKELHYWDTFEAAAQTRQINAFAKKVTAISAERDAARAEGRDRRVRNQERRITAFRSMINVLGQDREGHTAYAAHLMAGVTDKTRLVADVTPSYGLLSEERYHEMATLSPQAKFIYLMRDPLSRLWSAVRMQVRMRAVPQEDLEEKANAMLWRIIHKGREPQVTVRGDYRATLTRMVSAIPPEDRKAMFMEELVTQEGYGAFCDWVALPRALAPTERKVHEGPPIVMHSHLARQALELLRPQYDFVREHMGHLPEAWEKRLEVL